jgi:hypothetical protein
MNHLPAHTMDDRGRRLRESAERRRFVRRRRVDADRRWRPPRTG